MNNIQIHKSLNESETIIKSNENFVGMGLWNIGNELKYIRDNKTYKDKSYSSFEEYTEKELDYSRMHAYRFIEISEQYSVTSMLQIGHLGMTKLTALSKLEETEREEFIADNKVDEMTTRQLQQAIKEKKDAENKAELFEQQLENLKNQPPKVVEKLIEKEVIPKDYYKYKHDAEDKQFEIEKLIKEKELLLRKANLNDQNAKKYEELKSQIENLTQQKNDISSKIKASTELAGLSVRIENILKTELAPVKYSKAIYNMKDDEIVLENLTDIIHRVQEWVNEMSSYIPNNEIETIDVEVIE